MLGLHQIDGDGLDERYLMPPPQTWLEAEERRRTWWALYCSDRLVGGTAGWPVLIDEEDVSHSSTVDLVCFTRTHATDR